MGVSTFPEIGFLPGMTMFYAGATAPGGWLLCDGALLNRADYPTLFAAIGTAYNIGGETGAQFRVPNVKGKVIAGVDSAQTEFDTLGESGGFKTVALTQTEMPTHNHGVTVDTNNFSSGGHSADHSHYVHGNNFNTGWISHNHHHNMSHWHFANVGNMHWNGTQTHGHHGRGTIASEGPWEGANWASAVPVNVDGTAQAGPNGNNATGWVTSDHHHNANHDHGTAGASVGHTHTVNHAHTGTSSTTGSGVAHTNLQPYLTMNCIIKI